MVSRKLQERGHVRVPELRDRAAPRLRWPGSDRAYTPAICRSFLLAISSRRPLTP